MTDISTLFTTKGITESKRTIHTPGEFAKKNLLYVQEVGQLKSLQSHKSQRENLDSFLFLGILNGEGVITIENHSYKVKRGDCALINCMDYYAHESSKDNPWELIWVHFNGIVAKPYVDLFLEQNGNNIFKSENINVMLGFIDKLMRCQKEKELESELISGELLIQLVNHCLYTIMNRENANHEIHKKMCNEIRECVNERYHEEDLIHSLADEFKMDDVELDNSFHKYYGITLRDYIVNRRFTVAKELLRFTAKPVKEIINESGIKNEDLFRKLFQDGEGMTAEEYRMKWSQWVK